MKQRVLDPKLLIGSLVLIGLLLINAIFTYGNLQKLYTDTKWVIHTHKVIETIEDITSMVTLEEARQRGYIITDDPKYLESYDSILPLIPQQFKVLKKLVRDNPEQISRVEALETVATSRLNILNENLFLMREKGWKAAHNSIETGMGQMAMARLRVQSKEMIDAENKLLELRTQRSEDVYHATLFTSLLTNFISLVMMGIFLFILRLHLINRTKSENLLFEERELFRVTINSIGDGVMTTDTQGQVISLNAVAQSLTGWTQHEAQGRPMDEVFHIIHEQSRQPVKNPIWKVLQEGRIILLANHTVLISKDGKEVSIEDSAAPIRDRNGVIIGVVLVFRDITENNKNNEYRRRLASIVDTSDDAIISKDLQGTITSWNNAAERLFGYTAQEAIHQSILMLIPPDLRGEEAGILKRIQRGESIDHYQTVRQRKDGTLVDISLTISPIKDAHQKVIGASKIARDITKQRMLEEALRNSNKELEQFAYVASHDLKEPLHTISSFVDLCIRRFGEKMEKKEKEYLQAIKQAALQGQTLVKELLEFSRIGKSQTLETVDLADIVQKIRTNLNILITESNAQIQCDVPLPFIKGTSMEMGQLFQNLIENSIKYRSSEPPQIHISAIPSPNHRWRICIKDNGIGIDPAYKERIFDIFERLHSKSDSSGTGIGLAICKKIVEHYGGKIWVEKGEDKGSLFYFTLPAADA